MLLMLLWGHSWKSLVAPVLHPPAKTLIFLPTGTMENKFEMYLLRFIFMSGLLTEVQCQSKRLRKGSKGRGAEEEESAESRRVSSSSKVPGQVRLQC